MVAADCLWRSQDILSIAAEKVIIIIRINVFLQLQPSLLRAYMPARKTIVAKNRGGKIFINTIRSTPNE
jgi:hypothetical protein